MAETHLFDLMRYTIAQRLRLVWYTGHYMAAQRYAAKTPRRSRQKSTNPLPGREFVTAALRKLMAQDWRNIENGIYRMPSHLFDNPIELARLSRRFFRDLPKTHERRAAGSVREVATDEHRHLFPPYYLQNFHHQTDGYLSEDSARLYDFQVETLFTGMGDAMRRQALVPLYDVLKGKDQRQLKLLEIGCGTGSFLAAVKDNYPRLAVTGIDLSPHYLSVAARRLAGFAAVAFEQAKAEELPFADASIDVVACIYLYHELPPAVRRAAAKEIVRVLRPGGRHIFVESLQLGDEPAFDALLEEFPASFHEPYYRSYIDEDLSALFAPLAPVSDTPAFLSKISVFDKR